MAKRKWREYAAAEQWARSLGLKNYTQWKEFCKSGNKPDDIPANPRNAYGLQFRGYGIWLGTDNLPYWSKRLQFLTYDAVKVFVRNLGFSTRRDWQAYGKSGQRPSNVPSDPRVAYPDEWVSWGDFLGTNRIAHGLRVFRPFPEARAFVRELGLASEREWWAYCRSGQKPDDIPADPQRAYGTEWRCWQDWLGTSRTLNKAAILAILGDLRPNLIHLREEELYAILRHGSLLSTLAVALGGYLAHACATGDTDGGHPARHGSRREAEAEAA